MGISINYPNVVSIEANDNYTEFTIVTKNEELDMSESFSDTEQRHQCNDYQHAGV
jgi:hypothetical protein